MKFCHYTKTDADGNATEGTCHRDKLPTLATPGCSISLTMIDDEAHAKLVNNWDGLQEVPFVVNTKKAKKA